MERDEEAGYVRPLSREGESGATFAPIRSNGSHMVPPPSRGSGSIRSRGIVRIRSQNGYSVDDGEEDNAELADASGESSPVNGEKDTFEVGWDGGDNDPMCPRSFNLVRKWIIVAIVSNCSFCVTGASSIYTATYEQMEAHFGNSRIVSILGLSTFVLGIAFGPMFFSPLSEFYGRRPIYLVSWTLYVIWIIPQAVARNVATIIVGRFLDGFAGSTFLAVSGGTVGDLFTKEELQYPMAIFSLSPFIGPCIGPILGGFINYNVNWRWTYYVLLIWGGVLLAAIIFLVPETYHPMVLKHKAQKLRKETGEDRWRAPAEKMDKSVIGAVGRSLMRPFQLLFFELMCLQLCIFSAILLGILYLFFGAFPLVFRTNHGFNLWQVGLTFTGLFVGLVVGILTDPVWHRIRDRLMHRLEKETGVPGASEPEFRLPPAICGAVLVPIGIFWFGWSTYASVHWIVPIIGSAIFGMGLCQVAYWNAVLVMTMAMYCRLLTAFHPQEYPRVHRWYLAHDIDKLDQVDAYPQYAASALAANAFVRCTFAAAFPLFGNQMYQKLGYQWASSLLAFLTIAMLPFPYIFFKYGKKIRARSKFARN